jgi:hypothetical protein
MIEHEEFKSANRNSRIATGFATAALIVSIVATGFSIYFSIKQLDAPNKIDQYQLNKILQLKFDGSEINRRLVEVIETQKLQMKQLKKMETAQQEKHNAANQPTQKAARLISSVKSMK